MDSYAALIIDLRKSRSYTIETRYQIQRYLMRILPFLNKVFADGITCSVDFSAGDEIQGLFASAEAAYSYYRALAIWLHPVKIRAGIGVGSWDIQIEDKGTTIQDGRAYHNARYAIDHTDASEGYSILCYSRRKNDLTINTVIGSAAEISGKLSIMQNQLSLLAEILYPVFLSCKPDYSDHAKVLRRLLENKNYFDHTVAAFHRPLPFDGIKDDFPFEKLFSEIKTVNSINDDNFFVTGGKQRGIQSTLADILTITRQTIARSLDSANVYMVRNMAITAFIEMEDLS